MPLIQIDLQKVLNDKLGAKARFVPKWMVRKLEKIIRKDDLNELLRHNYPDTGADFCRGVLSDLNVTATLSHADRLGAGDNRRVIIVCNHPLGGLDGMVLIKELTGIYGQGVRFVVNDLLMAVAPLAPVFLPVNKHGSQDRSAISAINTAMGGNDPVVIFPAGLVSRRGSTGEIRDLRWNKMFVNKAAEYHRDVIPVHFSGRNTPMFYRLAQWRKRLGIKFNIEMLLLPSEVLKSRGKSFEVTVGHPISWEKLRAGKDAPATANEIREIVYGLATEAN